MSLLYIVKKGLFLSVYVDDIKLAGKKQNLDPMWKVLNKEVDLGEPTSFLDHVYLGCALNDNAKYHAPGNKFERFRGFLELISRFEFEFRRRENYFLKDSNFWCVHVNVPCPRNSISNVLASAIHDDRNIHFNETIVEGRKHIHVRIHLHVHVHLHLPTCGRGAGTHGDVLNLHTEAFLNVHTGTPHTPHRDRHRETETDLMQNVQSVRATN